MYKLLPQEQRQVVEREYAARRGVVMLIALIVVIVIGMVGLFPSYLLSKARRQEVLERTRVIGDSTLPEDEEALQGWLTSFNFKLKTLAPAADKDRPTLAMGEVLAERSLGIRLTGFAWSKVEAGAALAVSGIARDRQALITFENRLNASGSFGSVTLPVSNLAKDKDIEFQMNLTIAKTP